MSLSQITRDDDDVFHVLVLVLGVDCVVVKSGRRVCGTGAALANAPIVQDKSYFEVKIQCGGTVYVHVHRYSICTCTYVQYSLS